MQPSNTHKTWSDSELVYKHNNLCHNKQDNQQLVMKEPTDSSYSENSVNSVISKKHRKKKNIVINNKYMCMISIIHIGEILVKCKKLVKDIRHKQFPKVHIT